MVVAKKSKAQMVQRTWDVAGRGENVVEFTRACEEYRRNGEDAQGCGEIRGGTMTSRVSRRAFCVGTGGFFVVALSARGIFGGGLEALRRLGVETDARPEANNVAREYRELLYPPMDLSYFEKQIGWRA